MDKRIKIWKAIKWSTFSLMVLRVVVDLVFLWWIDVNPEQGVTLQNSLGWPVGLFWTKTVEPVIFAMLIGLLFTAMYENQNVGILIVAIISLGWTSALFRWHTAHGPLPYMVVDAVSWAVVSLCDVVFLVAKNQLKNLRWD